MIRVQDKFARLLRLACLLLIVSSGYPDRMVSLLDALCVFGLSLCAYQRAYESVQA